MMPAGFPAACWLGLAARYSTLLKYGPGQKGLKILGLTDSVHFWCSDHVQTIFFVIL
jgi:hypothetical protein